MLSNGSYRAAVIFLMQPLNRNSLHFLGNTRTRINTKNNTRRFMRVLLEIFEAELFACLRLIVPSSLSSAQSGNSCSTCGIRPFIPDAMEAVAGFRLQAQRSEQAQEQAGSQTSVKDCVGTWVTSTLPSVWQALTPAPMLSSSVSRDVQKAPARGEHTASSQHFTPYCSSDVSVVTRAHFLP